MKISKKIIYLISILFINLDCNNTGDASDGRNQNNFYISFRVNGENNKFFKGYYDSDFNLPCTDAYYAFRPDSTFYDSTGTVIIKKHIENYLLISCENEAADSASLFSTRSFSLMILKSIYGYHYLIVQYQNGASAYSSLPRQFMNEIDTSIILNDTLYGSIQDSFNLYPLINSMSEIDSTQTPLTVSDISFLLKRIR